MVSLVRICRYLLVRFGFIQVHNRSCVNYETTEDNEEWFCRSCVKRKNPCLERDNCTVENACVKHTMKELTVTNEFPFNGMLNVSSQQRTSIADENIIDLLFSPSLLRFWRTGADRHQLSIEEDDDIEVHFSFSANYNLYKYWLSRLAVTNMD
jgi:hypothetical protein